MRNMEVRGVRGEKIGVFVARGHVDGSELPFENVEIWRGQANPDLRRPDFFKN